MQLEELLQQMVQGNASDIFIIAGLPLSYQSGGKQIRTDMPGLSPDETRTYVKEVYRVADQDFKRFEGNDEHDEDFSFALPGIGPILGMIRDASQKVYPFVIYLCKRRITDLIIEFLAQKGTLFRREMPGEGCNAPTYRGSVSKMPAERSAVCQTPTRTRNRPRCGTRDVLAWHADAHAARSRAHLSPSSRSRYPSSFAVSSWLNSFGLPDPLESLMH